MDQRAELARDLRAIFNAIDRSEAETRLKTTAQNWLNTAPKLSAWLETNLPQALTVFSLPESHRRRLRTTNTLERLNQELKRRTRVASIFPTETPLERLVTALLRACLKKDFCPVWRQARFCNANRFSKNVQESC